MTCVLVIIKFTYTAISGEDGKRHLGQIRGSPRASILMEAILHRNICDNCSATTHK